MRWGALRPYCATLVLAIVLASPRQGFGQANDFRDRSLIQIQHLATLQPSTVYQARNGEASKPGELMIGSRNSYRWEGAAIGGILGGVAFAYLGLRVCQDDCVLAGGKAFIGGAVLGGFIGALVGGAFPKDPK